MAELALMTIAGLLIHLNGARITFPGRPYLTAIYECTSEWLVLRCARQCEKSTTLAILAILHAIGKANTKILVVLPTGPQLRVFRDDYLKPILAQSPTIERAFYLPRKSSATEVRFANGSTIYLRTAFHTADSSRGVSANVLILDEFQDLSADALDVLKHCLSHSPRKRYILSGTPKNEDNQLEVAFAKTKQNAWTVDCPKCGRACVPDDKVIGGETMRCPSCKTGIDFAEGHWVAEAPDAAWDGFWISHAMVPWRTHDEILAEREDLPPATFRNEILGLPCSEEGYAISRDKVLACCGDARMGLDVNGAIRNGLKRDSLVLGIDWSGGSTTRTAFAIGGYVQRSEREEPVFRVLHLERMPIEADHTPAIERAVELIHALGNKVTIAADGNGNGAVLNRQLLSRFKEPPGFCYDIFYGTRSHTPEIRTPPIYRWTLGRTRVIGNLIAHIDEGRIVFPRRQDCKDLLAEIWHQLKLYDAENRILRYRCASNRTDDTMHALVYAMAASGLRHSGWSG